MWRVMRMYKRESDTRYGCLSAVPREFLYARDTADMMNLRRTVEQTHDDNSVWQRQTRYFVVSEEEYQSYWKGIVS